MEKKSCNVKLEPNGVQKGKGRSRWRLQLRSRGQRKALFRGWGRGQGFKGCVEHQNGCPGSLQWAGNQDTQDGNSASHPLLYDRGVLRWGLAGESHVFILQEDGRDDFQGSLLLLWGSEWCKPKSSWTEQRSPSGAGASGNQSVLPVSLVSHLVSSSNLRDFWQVINL